MTDINAQEWRQNQAAWQPRLVRLDQAAQVPDEFKLVQTAQEFNLLAQPQPTLCYMPFQLSALGQSYIEQLQPDEFKTAFAITNLKVRAGLTGARSHFAYRKDVWVNPTAANGIDKPRMESILTPYLPDRPGRTELITDLAGLVEQVETRLGCVEHFRLLATKPWMPPPRNFAPHEDLIGDDSKPRLILLGTFAHPGALVCPTSASEPLCSREQIGGIDSVRHAKLDAYEQIYQLPAWHVGGWRSNSPAFKGQALAHATPPVTGSFRPHFIMQVRPNWLRPA